MDFNLLVRFFLLLFCLEGFPLPRGEACLPLRSLAAQVTSLLWSCNMVPLVGFQLPQARATQHALANNSRQALVSASTALFTRKLHLVHALEKLANSLTDLFLVGLCNHALDWPRRP